MNRTSSFGPGFHAPAKPARIFDTSSIVQPKPPSTGPMTTASGYHAAPDDAVNRSIVAALLKVLARREPGLQRSITVTLHRIFFLCAAGSLRCAEVPFELAPEHSAPRHEYRAGGAH